ncbi:hypothetical protein AJ79_02965 [Helicocarpus griseus UAMH5409]|uniref:HNH nuclease domain-containing protein n=1 Tax=Helicocarpus griseus UAMH5409 TaxID=1447875 RepID=A0A2B7Y022_9EURO|nr:hypothetical protein AJ79_02965 [Helicocarpus griseus UAMH5409]
MEQPCGSSAKFAEQIPQVGLLQQPAKRKRKSQTSTGDRLEDASISTNDPGILPYYEAAKDRIAAYGSPRGHRNENLVKCLNAFLDFLPIEGANSIANDILRYEETNDELFQVFENLRTGLLVPMRAASRGPSTVTSPISRSCDALESLAKDIPSSLARQLGFREGCLKRDNYSCVVTNVMDFDQWGKLGSPPGQKRGSIEVAHIIPFSYANSPDNETFSNETTER